MHRLVPILLCASIVAMASARRTMRPGGGKKAIATTITYAASGGSFTRASASSCRTGDGDSYTDLTTDNLCTGSQGTRVTDGLVNLSVNPEAVDLWHANSTTVTADYANAPDGSATADRVQMNATGDYIRDGTSGASCTPHEDINISVWMKSLTSECQIYLGNGYGSGFPEIIELVTVPTTWKRIDTSKIASLLGHCHTLIYRYNASADCTDFLVSSVQLEETSATAPGPYCAGGICANENLSWNIGDLKAQQGSMTIPISFGDRTSWDVNADTTILSIGASTTWEVATDVSQDALVFSAGGQTIDIPFPGSSWTEHTLYLTWQDGSLMAAWWDDGIPIESSGNYAAPTWTGDLSVNSGAYDVFFGDITATQSYSIPSRGSLYVQDFDGDLAPEVGVTSFTFARATAWTTIAAGGASMVALGVDAPSYIGQGEDNAGPDGDMIGIRVGGAAANYCRDIDGAVGATPTGWAHGGADRPKVSETKSFFGAKSAKWTETAEAIQRIWYATSPPLGASFSWQMYLDESASTSVGLNLGMYPNDVSVVFYPVSAGAHVFHKVLQDGVTGVANNFNMLGSYGDAPASGIFYIDAHMFQTNTLHPSPYCDGAAPPTTCGPESLHADLTATELPPAAGEVRLYVTPYWASDEAGIDRVLFYADADFKAWWDQSEKKWTFTAGGQSVASSTQEFPRDSLHHMEIIYEDGEPLTIQVDGQAAVASGGNYSTATLDTTKYLGSSSGGGDEIDGWVRMEVRP